MPPKAIATFRTEATTQMSKQAKIDEIVLLKGNIATLLTNIREVQGQCAKHHRENQYLQDYVGSMMKQEHLK